ncbi:MAG: putative DNA binding domain-containing protein [Flexilinea sp.]|nr:putative DNA binding domain-containing protein [Flexilinea sp.]
MNESKNLEFKESVSNNFLKTVSAFANYGAGKILFGIRDDGSICGISDTVQTCLDIENKINDNIDPVPEYSLSINKKTSVITLTVYEGTHKPYFYKSKAYRRNDTATIPADRLELTRLILEGQNLTFEEIPSKNQDLSFHLLEERLKTILHLNTVDKDTLKTLELYRDDTGFNNAAGMLADVNLFCGIDIVRFGDNINIIQTHNTFEHQSILQQYDEAFELYRQYYQYEQINGSHRETVSQIPEKAYREGIANALVHRTWDLNAHINVAMFNDRIEITSPGGLPRGLSEEEYLRGGVSILRNRIIANIFYRLQMIEKFGTGIRRIIESYKDSAIKPTFLFTENTIQITLPVMKTKNSLSGDESIIYELLKGRIVSISEITEGSGFGRTKTKSILSKLILEGYIYTIGNGRGTKYSAE